MTPFTVYDSTGRILRTGLCQKECLELQAREGEFVLPLPSNDETDWVSVEDEAVMFRPQIQLEVSAATVVADGTSEVTITGAPAGARIIVTGPVTIEGESDGDPIHLAFSLAGTYEVTVSLFPNLDAKVSIHAT